MQARVERNKKPLAKPISPTLFTIHFPDDMKVMGIRGLTTFINNRAHLYLKDHELHDCNVVLDGNSLASNLYKWHCKSNDCFGGDYDKFAQVIRNFFSTLSQCNITSYIILDGGYEKRKLNTVVSRMKNKICAAESLNAMTEGSAPVFPLFLREVFVDVVLSLGLKVARCEFEGDMEIAGIAQALNCPVISYDSDFYVLGCLYIPFTTVEVTARKAYGGLDKGNLPLLAVILGNDYINGRLFAPFFRNLKMQKCSSNQSDQQKRIKSVIVWLQNENIESAIRTILSRFKNHRRQVILSQIESAMKGYNEVNSELLKFLDIDQSTLSNFCIDFNRLRISEEPESKTDDSESDDESGIEHETLDSVEEPEEKSTVKSLNSDIQDNIITTKIFQEKYRACQYPACFMDMISLSRYYCVPQVENSSAEHSHTISLDLLKIVYQILTPNCSRGLTIVFRNGKHGIKYVILPRIALDTPSLGEIQVTKTFEKKFAQTLANAKQSIKQTFSNFENLVYDECLIFLANLRKRTDIVEYLNVFLNECPSLLEGIKYLISIADSNFNCENTKSQHMKKHRKKKKQPINTEISGDPESSEEESESVFDPNNPFSILSCFQKYGYTDINQT
ncbi:hypothetical protein HUJ05_003378 [Dendroctonus ponderosae]|nr:hypothetical protein HUJ05_003378 [Dendroctonus ponderosae]